MRTGAVPNVIELNKHASTLITGTNGKGKSTILCALTFALFGKPFREVNKNDVINSINGKKCMVEIEFSVNGLEYKVRRGLKPNIFEIFCNGELVNQEASNRDYQKVLEQQILKLSYKTFTQVVILGSATFVPFMRLPAAGRREVIEDILDIKIFSIMNQLLKEKAANTKDQISMIESQMISQKTLVNSQSKLVEVLETSRKALIESKQSKIDENNKIINEANERIDEIQKSINLKEAAYATKYEWVPDKIQEASKMRGKVSSLIENCEHDVDFFKTNTDCPKCSQPLDESYKQTILEDLDKKIDKHKAKLDDVVDVLNKLNERLDKGKWLLDDIRTSSIELSTLCNTVKIISEQNGELSKEMEVVNLDVSNLDFEKKKMSDIADEAISLVTQKSDLLDQRQLQDLASMLLKDTGVKTAIIREYLPIVNKLINKYLSAMDFFVKFEMDEAFRESIKSRGRDSFTYYSFSEGEKRRIDLAILFTWRQIAKMKNSINTNILILDEILDGSLDFGGIDYFLSIMNQFGENSNVIIISPKSDQMVDKFDNVIRFITKNDFSVIDDSN